MRSFWIASLLLLPLLACRDKGATPAADAGRKTVDLEQKPEPLLYPGDEKTLAAAWQGTWKVPGGAVWAVAGNAMDLQFQGASLRYRMTFLAPCLARLDPEKGGKPSFQPFLLKDGALIAGSPKLGARGPGRAFLCTTEGEVWALDKAQCFHWAPKGDALVPTAVDCSFTPAQGFDVFKTPGFTLPLNGDEIYEGDPPKALEKVPAVDAPAPPAPR